MSEIKAQLLGIVLVLGLFAAVSVAAYSIFNATAKSVAAEVSEVTGQTVDVNIAPASK